MNNTSLGRNKMPEYKNTILGNADTICLHWVMKYLKKDQEAHRLCENVMSESPKGTTSMLPSLLFISQTGESYIIFLQDRLQLPTH